MNIFELTQLIIARNILNIKNVSKVVDPALSAFENATRRDLERTYRKKHSAIDVLSALKFRCFLVFSREAKSFSNIFIANTLI